MIYILNLNIVVCVSINNDEYYSFYWHGRLTLFIEPPVSAALITGAGYGNTIIVLRLDNATTALGRTLLATARPPEVGHASASVVVFSVPCDERIVV